jgi:hypothetical protein
MNVGGRVAARFGRSVAVAAVLAAGLVGGTAVSPVDAAPDALSLVSKATYTLVPAKGVVRVSVDVTAKNNKPNLVRETPNGTLTTRYFYESASLAIHAEAKRIRATSGGAVLTTKLRRDEGFSVLEVRFRKDLFFGQTTKIRIQYDLPGGAPRSDSDIRVGSAFATFYAWAFGDRGNVRITLPAGFEVETSGETVAKSVKDGVTTLSAAAIADVNEWYVVVVADRHDALATERIDLPDGEHLVVRGWPEDEEWRDRVGSLLRTGLPVLAEKVGLDWPVPGDIEVAEVHTPLLEGYAGVFYAREDRIEISEDLDELTIIHEASHAWFNGNLFVGRWIDEGFADEYASRVLDEVSVGGLRPDSVSPTDAAAVRLNDWEHPGRIDDDATRDREHYGYEASWTAIRALIGEIGEDGMRSVLKAANLDETAYVGSVAPEKARVANDWRRFLDLLEERGGSKSAVELFRRWVVTTEQETLLDARAKARDAYAQLVAAGRGWLPGFVVRDPLGRWQFDRATQQIAGAREILATRDEIERLAVAAGAAPPANLEQAYEAAATDLGPVRDVAARELAAVTAFDAAASRVNGERGLLTSIGLIGDDPAARLAAVSASFSAGDLDATAREAAEVIAHLDEAPNVGRTRVVAGGVVGAGAAAGGAGALIVLRRRRRATPSLEAAPPPATEADDRPYATLGDPAAAEPVEPVATEPAEPGRDEGDGS